MSRSWYELIERGKLRHNVSKFERLRGVAQPMGCNRVL
jgi:hypothetical protein